MELFFPFLKILGQFSRHGVGVPSYITNLYNKQASKQASKQGKKKERKKKNHFQKGGAVAPLPLLDGPDIALEHYERSMYTQGLQV